MARSRKEGEFALQLVGIAGGGALDVEDQVGGDGDRAEHPPADEGGEDVGGGAAGEGRVGAHEGSDGEAEDRADDHGGG